MAENFNFAEKEHQVLTAMQNRDVKTLQTLLEADGIGVDGPHGYMTNKALWDAIEALQIEWFKMIDPQVIPVGNDGAIVTYRYEQKASFAGHNLPEKTYATSIWEKRSSSWKIVFHQETLIP